MSLYESPTISYERKKKLLQLEIQQTVDSGELSHLEILNLMEIAFMDFNNASSISPITNVSNTHEPV